jgi:hypothetical protein
MYNYRKGYTQRKERQRQIVRIIPTWRREVVNGLGHEITTTSRDVVTTSLLANVVQRRSGLLILDK